MTRYRTIVVDPPWNVEAGPRSLHGPDTWRGEGRRRNRTLAYRTLSVPEISALPVARLAEPDAHLYLWTINSYVEQAYAVARAWGFKPSTLLVWAKAPKGRGLGGRFSIATEYVLFAQRGSIAQGSRVERNWWQWPRGAHSAKPDAFLDLVESVSPGPYVELFARRARFGWDYWGDESLGTASLGGEAA